MDPHHQRLQQRQFQAQQRQLHQQQFQQQQQHHLQQQFHHQPPLQQQNYTTQAYNTYQPAYQFPYRYPQHAQQQVQHQQQQQHAYNYHSANAYQQQPYPRPVQLPELAPVQTPRVSVRPLLDPTSAAALAALSRLTQFSGTQWTAPIHPQVGQPPYNVHTTSIHQGNFGYSHTVSGGAGPSFIGRAHGPGNGGPLHFPPHGVTSTSSHPAPTVAVKLKSTSALKTEVPKSQKPQLRCEICQVSCTTLEILKQHTNGKRHKRNIEKVEQMKNSIKSGADAQDGEEKKPTKKHKGRSCGIGHQATHGPVGLQVLYPPNPNDETLFHPQEGKYMPPHVYQDIPVETSSNPEIQQNPTTQWSEPLPGSGSHSIVTEEPEIRQAVTEEPEIRQAVTEEPEIRQAVTEEPEIRQAVTEEPETGQAVTEEPGTGQSASIEANNLNGASETKYQGSDPQSHNTILETDHVIPVPQ